MIVFMTGAGGFIGGTVARRLQGAGHSIRGLVRGADKAAQLDALGIAAPVGSSVDHDGVVGEERSGADGINAAESDHLPLVVEALIGGRGAGNPPLHTSGSSVIGDDARGNHLSET